MYRPLTNRRRAPRRGALLIAVLGMLTLMAIFALFFVFYADAEATGARIAREKEANGDSGTPDDFAAYASNVTLAAILFDTTDSDYLNPLRGYGLARTIYGWTGTPGPGTPFSGQGMLHDTTGCPTGADRSLWINHAAPFNVFVGPQLGTWWKDPEWTTYRTSLQVVGNPAATPAIPPAPPPSIGGNTYVPANAPYTYPDLNNLFLASLSPATGEVIVPSFHRQWLFNMSNINPVTSQRNWAFLLAPWNPNDNVNPSTMTSLNTDWITAEGRTKILRARPIDQLTPQELQGLIGLNGPPTQAQYNALSNAQKQNLFNAITNGIRLGYLIPYPPQNVDGSFTADVQNLLGGGGNPFGMANGPVQHTDSILIDIGIPPRIWNGKWIKPLAAILITDLDALLNINVHGNMRGSPQPSTMFPNPVSTGFHNSNHGFGASEVSLWPIMGQGEATGLLMARNGTAGPSGLPNIKVWQPNTQYFVNDVIVNYGNYYICTIPLMPGTGLSAAGGSGPTGDYQGTAASPDFVDNQLTWRNWQQIQSRNLRFNLPFERNGVRAPAYSMINFDAGGNQPQINLPSFSPPGAANIPFVTSPQYTAIANGIMGATMQTPFEDGFFDGLPADTYNKQFNHPLMYNAKDWPSGLSSPFGGGRRMFPLSDLKRLNFRYAAERDWYTQSDLAKNGVATGSLVGTTAPGPAYRLDPAHPNRLFFTTRSTTIDTSHFVGNFNKVVGNATAASFLQTGSFGNLPNFPTLPQVPSAFPGQFPTGATGVTISDFNVMANGGSNFQMRRALGPVDINRPLNDYRSDTGTPLGVQSTTVATDTFNNNNYQQAWVDRQNLCRDIFARFIVATGAVAIVDGSGNITLPQPTGASPPYLLTDPTGGPSQNVSQVEYNQLRYLAQLAANMVDYVDTDDISTAFVWNPISGSTTPPFQPVPLSQFTISNFFVSASDATTNISGNTITPTTTTDRVVFGVEKPRVVINEAIGEITNNPTVANPASGVATANASVRFWVELANPTSTAYSTGGGPLGTAATGGTATLYNANVPYQLQIQQMNAAQAASLIDPSNPKGDVAMTAGFVFDFSTAAGALASLSPLNGTYNPVVAGNGIVLVGPAANTNAHTSGGVAVEFNPNGAGQYATQMIVGNALGAPGNTAMEYNYGSMPASTALEAPPPGGMMQTLRRHAVILRRLANPYQPQSLTNPYITVDVMDYVPAFDAVIRGGAGDTGMDRSPKPIGMGTPPYQTTDPGFEPISYRFSVGRVQPYAGFASQGAGSATHVAEIGTFPNSMVIQQNPNPLNAGVPQHTFFRLNGRSPLGTAYSNQTYTATPPSLTSATNPANPETFMAPFDWLVHMDRPLVNQMELLQMQGGRSHEVSQFTLLPPLAAGGALRKNHGFVPWMGVFFSPLPPSLQPGVDLTTGGYPHTNNNLYRALELLRIKPWTYGAALGGKVHGKMNINTMQDQRLLQALLDPQTLGNGFTATDVSNVWLNMFNPTAPTAGQPYRTVGTYTATQADGVTTRVVPFPGPTVDDLGSATATPPGYSLPPDRPFKSLGIGEFWPDAGVPPQPLAQRAGSGIQDTLLRVDPTSGIPLITSTSQGTSYYQSEMARKMFNNTTTTSNNFAISVTIVFHEVRMINANPSSVDDTTYPAGVYTTGSPPVKTRWLLGREAFKDMPGDLRQQFFAVVDRSNLALGLPGSPQVNQLIQQPMYAGLDQALNGVASGTLAPIVGAGTPTSATPNLNNPVPPAGFSWISPPQGSVNIYLSDAVGPPVSTPPGTPPMPYATNLFNQLTVFSDGFPVTLQGGQVISIGNGANQEVVRINYVNEDGSLNVGDPTNQLGFGILSPPTKTHFIGELATNCMLGNPGPVNPGNLSNPGPFDVLSNPNSVYRGVVPYARRVR